MAADAHMVEGPGRSGLAPRPGLLRRGLVLLTAVSLVTAITVVLAPRPASGVPILPAPGCDSAPVDGDIGDLCPGDPDLQVTVTGDIGVGAAVTIAPTMPPCISSDGFGTFTPSRCYSGMDFDVASEPLCAYLDSYDRGADRPQTFHGRSSFDCSTNPYYETLPGSLLYDDWLNTDYRTGLAHDSCRPEFNLNYIYGGPANDVSQVWANRGPASLTCTFTRQPTGPDGSDSQPNGLFGPTWVKVNVSLTVQENGSSSTQNALAWLPVDGSERDRAPIAEFRQHKLVGDGNYEFLDQSVSQYGHAMGYEWTFDVIDPGDADYRTLGTAASREPQFVFEEGTYARVTLTVTDLVNGLTDTIQHVFTIDRSAIGETPLGDNAVVTVEATDDQASEAGLTTGTWTVSRTKADGPLTVAVATSGTATEGGDYQRVAKFVSFPAGVSDVPVALLPIDDTEVEGPEVATLTVERGDGYTVGDPDSGDITILSDDGAVTTTTTTAPPTTSTTTTEPPITTTTTAPSTTTTTTTPPTTTTAPPTTTTTAPPTTTTTAPPTTTTTTVPPSNQERAERYVRAVFEALVGRAPGTSDDLTPWVTAIARRDTVPTRQAVVAAIAASAEYRGRLIDGAYATDLGRRADPGGRRYWTDRLARTSLSTVRAQLLTSREARRGRPSDAELIRSVYQAVLGREPDPNGAAFWLRWLERGGSTTGFALRVLRGHEAARGTVVDAYQRLLERPPTTDELDRWVPIVAAQDLRPLAVAILASDEWRATVPA